VEKPRGKEERGGEEKGRGKKIRERLAGMVKKRVKNQKRCAGGQRGVKLDQTLTKEEGGRICKKEGVREETVVNLVEEGKRVKRD